MAQTLIRLALAGALSAASAYAGALFVQVGSPDGNSEAKSVHAAMVAEVTACHDPAKSTLTAYVIQQNGAAMRRVALNVIPLKKAGMFAIVGNVPPSSVVDLAVSNPDYRNYQPHVLVRSDEHGPRWASVKRFFEIPPTDADVKALL